MKFVKQFSQKHRGAVLIIAMVFIVIFSVLAVSMASFTGNNAQISNNQHKLNLTRSTAESGLEIMRYWFSRVHMSGDTTPAERFSTLGDFVQSDMATNAGIYVTKNFDSGNLISFQIDGIQINSIPQQLFSVIVTPTLNIDVLQMDVTGTSQEINRTLRVNYNYGTRAHSVFDFGVATRGPLNLSGNIELTGINVSVEADVYIESMTEDQALSIIGNSQIAGDVKITNPDAYVTLQGGQAGIGGETGQDAIDNHVDFGVPPTEFPLPMPTYFEQYIQSDIDMNDTIFENVRIPAGTNPIFGGGETFKGVLYIEQPNVVTFSGHVTVIGLIIGNGDVTDNSGTNRIDFLGTVESHPVTDLPETDPQYTQLRDETGTFLMAPGFGVSFGGNFDTINGAIAANGIDFFGDAGGTINGSIVNYSNEPMGLSGNSDLFFNRSGTTEVPAGFGPEIILYYNPLSYSEVF